MSRNIARCICWSLAVLFVASAAQAQPLRDPAESAYDNFQRALLDRAVKVAQLDAAWLADSVAVDSRIRSIRDQIAALNATPSRSLSDRLLRGKRFQELADSLHRLVLQQSQAQTRYRQARIAILRQTGADGRPPSFVGPSRPAHSALPPRKPSVYGKHGGYGHVPPGQR